MKQALQLSVPVAMAGLLFASFTAAAQPAITDADRAFAQELSNLPEDAARARLAADSSRITAGLCEALSASVNDTANRNQESPKVLRVLAVAADAARQGGFTLQEADARFVMGWPLSNMGRFDEALESYNLALDLYLKAGAKPVKRAGLFANRANVLRHLSDYAAAIQDIEAATQLYRALGDEVGVARVLNNKALVFEETGDYGHAMEALQQSLEIAERHDERQGQGYLLNNMAELSMMQGNYTLAASLAAKSIAIKQANSSREDMASSLTNLAVIYHKAKQDALAGQTLKEVLEISRAANRKPVIADALGESGVIALDNKNYPAAIQHLQESLALCREIGDRRRESRTLGELARTYFAAGYAAKALDSANRSRELARQAGTLPDTFVPSLIAGQVYRAQGHSAEARAALDEAVATVEEMRDKVAGGEFGREMFLAERSAPYREIAGLEAREGHWTEALSMSERAKGRVLLDLVHNGRENLQRLMSTEERSQDLHLRRKLAGLGAQLRLASTQQPAALRAQIDAIRAELDDLRRKFYAEHPDVEVRSGDVHPVSSAEITALAGDDHIAILDYVATPDAVYLFVLARGKRLTAHRIAASPAALRRDVKEFREKMATRDPEFPAVASRLYNVLVAPARAELAGKTRLVVVPDTDLWQVPFQALCAPGGRYLLEDESISYAPSLSVLAALRKVRRPPAGAPPSLAAFGNPTGDWAESETEVRKLVALDGSATSRAWVGPEATEANFRQKAGAYDVVHVAAHGVVDDRNPLRSRLVFHPPAEKPTEDGWLEVGEIRELDLRAKLVVLSGCETGRGAFEDGEGVIGMAWAFLASGARSVLASQWRVESTSTTQLMLRFHTGLLAGAEKSDALRDAALELRKNDRFRHPFYWAGFQLFGE
jgi:CHAT domain-containing protein